MHVRFLNPFLLVLLIAIASGCGGSADSHSIDSEEPGQAVDMAAGRNIAHSYKYADLVAEIEANPGVAGVDFDPNYITVGYRAGRAEVADAGRGNLGGASIASSKRNPMLRKNRQYEPLTDDIAAIFNLEIESQVYIDDFNFAAFKLPTDANAASVIQGIKQQFAGDVEYVYHSRLYKQHFSVPDPWYNASSPDGGPQMQNHPQWGQQRIGCTNAWDYTRGDPAFRIAVVDTGVRLSHEELGQVLDPEVAFPEAHCDIRNDDNTVEDTEGHGTFIAGLMAATRNSNTLIGVAHECEIIPIKISNGGLAPDFRMAEGCVLAHELDAKVINLSWGGEGNSPTLDQMVNFIFNNGSLLVVSAGNDGGAVANFPAASANAFSVGSSNTQDGRSDFSNFHSSVDIAAPGEWLGSSSINGNADNAYGIADGTSFSAPLVASAAALAWILNPGLSVTDMRNLLTSTGVPATGFSGAVPRLDLAAALESAAGLLVKAPRLDKLVQQGSVTLTPEIVGTQPDSVEMWFNGTPVETKNSAPWTFELDTSSIGFGIGDVQFVARAGGEESAAGLKLVIDNTAGTFPLQDNFNGGPQALLAYDARNLTAGALNALVNLPAGDPTPETVSSSGPGFWQASTSNVFEGTHCMYCGDGSGNYGENEVDTLVSRRLSLPSNGPTAVFQHRFNIEKGNNDWDRAWILVTTNYGQSFSAATLKGGGAAFFTGLQAAYVKAEIDLSAFAGQKVHLILALQSDGDISGEDTGQSSGWWVDQLTVATNYSTSVPTIGGVNVGQFSLYGSVPSLAEINATVSSPVNVARVRYILDLAPLGKIETGVDLIEETTASPYQKMLPLPTNVNNQVAQLLVQYFDSNNNAGPEVVVPVYVFNQLGDVNADGRVDAADSAAFSGKLGLNSGDAGYVPFFDSDLNGVINEADASAVGYHWQP